MFKSYLLIALRNLKKQKAYSLINIMGMAVGMAGFALFALMAGVKLNADKFHTLTGYTALSRSFKRKTKRKNISPLHPVPWQRPCEWNFRRSRMWSGSDQAGK